MISHKFIIFGKAKATLLDIAGIMLEPLRYVKIIRLLLLVFIGSMRNFKDTVAYVKKTGRGIIFLARVWRYFEYNNKMYVLQAFVSCFYNYCLVVWHTIGMENTNKIEKVQYRALKYILNDFKYPYNKRIMVGVNWNI